MVHPQGAAPIRALIVEDNRDICENIAAYLEKHSYVMDFAYDGIGAMHLALTNPFDVIVLDLMLPRMDGLSRTLLSNRDVMIPRGAGSGTSRKRLDSDLSAYSELRSTCVRKNAPRSTRKRATSIHDAPRARRARSFGWKLTRETSAESDAAGRARSARRAR